MSLRPGDIAQVEDPEFNQQHSEPRPAAWERWDCLGHFGTELTGNSRFFPIAISISLLLGGDWNHGIFMTFH